MTEMAEEMPRKLHSTFAKANFKLKKRGIFSSTSRKDNLPATTQLMFPKDVEVKSSYLRTIRFKTVDKISILFKYKQYCVVQRKHDGTVAVLKGAVFKERNPPMLFDGTKLEAALSNKINIVLMYSLAETSYSKQGGIEFEKYDVIFTLAACGNEFLGITQNYKVGFFPSNLVRPLTKRRLCFFEGMMLKVTAFENYEIKDPKELSVRQWESYEINKGRKGLFDWYTSNHLKVPLNSVNENDIDVPAVVTRDEEIYHTVSEIKEPIAAPVSGPLYDTQVPVFNSSQNALRDLPLPPLGRCNSQYMVSNASSSLTESSRYVPTPTNVQDISDEDYDTVDFEETGITNQERALCDRVPHDCGAAHSPYGQTVSETKNKPNDKIQDLLNNLANFRDLKVDGQIKSIVSEYVDEDVWDQLGRELNIPKNKRREIEDKRDSIYVKTNEVLNLWCERSDATIGFLLDALVKVNLEDLELVLEDVCKALSDRDGSL